MELIKIVTGGVGVVLVAGVILATVKPTDNELVSRLPSMHEFPHIPYNNYRVPEYTNIIQVTNSTSGMVVTYTAQL